MVSVLFEVKPTDPTTLIGVALLLAAVAMLACYIPARRACLAPHPWGQSGEREQKRTATQGSL